MSWKNTEARFGSLSIALHWLMFLLLVAVYFTMEFRGIFPKGSEGRDLMKHWHFMLGLAVFFLVWVRIAARLIAPSPKIMPEPPVLQEKIAKLMYLALYLLMICTPLLGWLFLSAAGKPIPFFGLELPPLTGKDHAFAEQIEEWHVLIAEAGYWLIGIHTVAALYHHYVVRDNALLIMKPERK
jgi:cytochrome b561